MKEKSCIKNPNEESDGQILFITKNDFQCQKKVAEKTLIKNWAIDTPKKSCKKSPRMDAWF